MSENSTPLGRSFRARSSRGDQGLDFSGPFVRGDRTDRHLALAWGDVPGDGTLRLFRLAKLRLAEVDHAFIEDAMRAGYRLVARVRLTDARGNPSCADVSWSAERAAAAGAEAAS